MGEVPILTISAQVFQIDQETKSKWLNLTQTPVPVSLYHDGSRNTYRIICVDDNKVIINCFVKPKMKFVKTSQKFGQWVDSQAATVYGIGCKSEVELMKFADKFEEVKQIVSPDSTHSRSASKEEKSIASNLSLDQLAKDSNGRMANGLPSKPPAKKPAPFVTSSTENLSGGDQKCTNSKCVGMIALLRAENDRLKLELTHSSAKSKELDLEVQSLKSNNASLTAAVEEARKNTEEWQSELYEANNKLAGMDLLLVQLKEAQDKSREVEQVAVAKGEELTKLKQQFGEYKRTVVQNQKTAVKLQEAETENIRLKKEVTELTAQLEQTRLSGKPNHDGLKRLQEEISSKINELYAMNDMLAEELHSYLDA